LGAEFSYIQTASIGDSAEWQLYPEAVRCPIRARQRKPTIDWL